MRMNSRTKMEATNKQRGLTRDQEQPLGKVKRDFEGWRKILLPLHNVLKWDKSFYSPALLGIVIVFFLIIWIFEPSVLTMFSVIGVIICLTDFLVPTFTATMFGPDNWTGEKERQFEAICLSLLTYKEFFNNACEAVNQLKETRPKTYVAVICGLLVALAIVGDQIDNLLLTYIIVSFLVLLPGMKHQRICQKYGVILVNYIINAIGYKPKQH